MNKDLETNPNASVRVVPGGPVSGSIRPPGSKSLTNRALICAALAAGSSNLSGALRSEDTEVMIESLGTIGIEVESADAGRTLTVGGLNQDRLERDVLRELFVANSGTTIRFLTAALSALGGHYRLSGVERMHARPIGDLVDALSQVQAGSIAAQSEGHCPPVAIQSQGWSSSTISVAGNVSSQYLSGLMMAAPLAASSDQPIKIEVVGTLVSRPYVDMTAEVMRSFGADVHISDADSQDGTRVVVGDGGYSGQTYSIEPDASAASYFWAAAAITGGEVTVLGLHPGAMQGDVGFCRVLEQMGCEFQTNSDGMMIRGRASRGIDIDMNAISDTVQTLSVVALFADGPTRVRGVAHNRFKETDRIGDLAVELRKLGATVDEHEDGMTIVPPEKVVAATLETYNDHRMAMSFSLAGLAAEGITVLNPACTAKTYPEYFADLEHLIGRPHHWGNSLDQTDR
ncbi:MAG: 3-phosphoshikimate 1-carboxyvinyltransferase [Planctomycetota bacterium]